MYLFIPKNLKKKIVNYSLNELREFETKIAKDYNDAKIRGPIHLSHGNENQLIKIFEYIDKDDWVFQVGETIIMLYCTV